MNLETANALLGLLANAVRFYAIKRFIDIFFAKEECRWKKMWILYVTACCGTSLIYELFKTPIWNILSNLVALFLVILPYKVRLSKKILHVFLIYIVNALVDCIVVLPLVKYTVGQPFNQVYECVTSLVILLITVILERTVMSEKKIGLPVFYKFMLGFVPVISTVCAYYIGVTAKEMKGITILISSSLLIINIIVIYLYNALERFYAECYEKKMYEQMLNVYAYQLDVMRESQEQVKVLRHDMKHHIIELSSRLNDKENPEAIRYLQDMGKFMLNPKEFAATGNREVDGILNYLLQSADKVLKHVETKITIPEEVQRLDFGICVILGNLVENAIRESAKSEEKYLAVNIRTKKGILLIYIENSYTGEILKEKDKFRTTQEDPAIHGIGLENVKKIVKTNGGEISIDYTENRFKVQVLL